MTRDELKKFDKDLEKEEKELRHQLSIIANKDPNVKGNYQTRVPQYGDDGDAYAHEVTDLDRNLAIEHELETRLWGVQKTRERIKMGDYGKCDNCSKEIESARLKVMPVAYLCVSCAQSQTKK